MQMSENITSALSAILDIEYRRRQWLLGHIRLHLHRYNIKVLSAHEAEDAQMYLVHIKKFHDLFLSYESTRLEILVIKARIYVAEKFGDHESIKKNQIILDIRTNLCKSVSELALGEFAKSLYYKKCIAHVYGVAALLNDSAWIERFPVVIEAIRG
jgi:hypothetical protein